MRTASGSYRDPENAAVAIGDRWFRVAAPGSAAALTRLRESGLYGSLVGQGAIVEYQLADAQEEPLVLNRYREATGREVIPGSRVFAVETVDLITYPWEWPNHLLQAAGLLTLDIREQLLTLGLDLKDASAFNIQFRGMQPLLIDLGSIEVWRPNPTWNPTRQFVEHFINPLAVGSGRHLSAADVWDLSRRRGLRSEMARSLMPMRLRWRPSLWVLQASTKPVADHAPVETKYAERAQQNQELALKASLSLTRRLRRQTLRLATAQHRTTWQDYGRREHYADAELERKVTMSRAFVEHGSRGRLVLDVGGNDGLVAVDLIANGAGTVIVMDPDSGALDVLSRSVAGTPELRGRITPLYADLVNLTPASGLLNSEYSAFTDRIRPTAVLCQAVLHHIVITQGVPMTRAVEALAGFGAPLMVEFVTEDDAKAVMLRAQIPNWSGEYSTRALLDALDRCFVDVSVVGRTSEHRIAVTTGRPKS